MSISLTLFFVPCLRAPGEEEGGIYAGVEDSQEVCTTSFSTSPPSQVETQPNTEHTKCFLLVPLTPRSTHSQISQYTQE